MEPPAKRQRVGPLMFGDDNMADDDDELSSRPEEINARRDPGYQLQKSRAFAALKLKSRFESIFEKYEKDFEGIGDEIDLRTGEIVVDNGHIQSLQNSKLGEDDNDADSVDEEERILQGKSDQRLSRVGDSMALTVQPRMSPFSPFAGVPPLARPQTLSGMMYPGQMGFGGYGMGAPFGMNPLQSMDPTWSTPDLPMPVFGGFGMVRSAPRTKAKVALITAGGDDNEDDLLLGVSTSVSGATPDEESVKETSSEQPADGKDAESQSPRADAPQGVHQAKFKIPETTKKPVSKKKPTPSKSPANAKSKPTATTGPLSAASNESQPVVTSPGASTVHPATDHERQPLTASPGVPSPPTAVIKERQPAAPSPGAPSPPPHVSSETRVVAASPEAPPAEAPVAPPPSVLKGKKAPKAATAGAKPALRTRTQKSTALPKSGPQPRVESQPTAESQPIAGPQPTAELYFDPFTEGRLAAKPLKQKLQVEIRNLKPADISLFRTISPEPTPEPESVISTITTTEEMGVKLPESQPEPVEQAPRPSPPSTTYSRNIVDPAYVFSDEEEPALSRSRFPKKADGSSNKGEGPFETDGTSYAGGIVGSR
ncbi:hypothetical protein QBC47DRAFT_358680 [Echria macrotheca]|uniref:Myb-like DNA-binding domain protein n=1 Tax=Echria macrotheca TaxID=438768 RepID=A0AAJ0BGD7_9PEZI|nr:hypothetical protein QBC47DRAFT_358680 [Echria macrotheca]